LPLSRKIVFERRVLDGLLDYSKSAHPNEGILLLRGKISKDEIHIKDLIMPPLAVHGEDFSTFSPYMLPLDTSILGVAHSHPNGVLEPSLQDLNHYYGKLMVIVAYPYSSEDNVGIFDHEGEQLFYQVK
jgi:proteasome lid subunit RPN8/RPN11